MSVLTLEAKLERLDPNTPWGFRMQGGKDFHSALMIQKVTSGSLAAKCGLQSGDIILKIGKLVAETLKHKEAQDAILSYGNKLDLLLQRSSSQGVLDINKLNINSTAAAPPSPIPSPIPKPASPVPSKPVTPPPPPPPPPPALPASSGSGPSSNFNAVARPFPAGQHSGFSHGSGETFPPPPTVFQPSLNKYAEAEEDRPTSTQQSRSFKLLQGLMDSGQEPPPALRPLNPMQSPNRSRSVSPLPSQQANKGNTVKAVGNWQYNSPIGLYSKENVAHTFKDQTNILISSNNGDSKENGDVRKSSLTNDSSVSVDAEKSGVEYDGEGRILYKPSETYKLIHGESDQADTTAVPLYSKTFKRLQEKLDGAPVASYTPPPAAPAPPPPQVQLFSLPKQAAHTPRAPPPPPAPAIVPKAPPPPPVHRPQAVTKPKLPSGPPKPTGQGATKGKKGDAVYKNPDQSGRIPVCAACGTPIRGPFVLAMGKSWCPAHFVCANPNCGVKLFDIGFVEEGGFLYCEKDYELYFAPHCHKCNQVIIGECVNAMNTTFHPNCFLCAQCRKPIGGSSFHIEDGEFYCDPHWKEMFQAICFGCKYPIDPGDRWVEAMDHSYHSDCFVCTTCQVSLEGQPFYAKTGKPYCKKHAR
ncbi:and LIM domain Zasp isoform X2 [Octopus vulgaris]|uniref:And LIM domain Zasp isoform X2 n=2 Tax=Octopus TaxID=6643 RepID=A0AA36B217_OCTVU|nr:PDZ and LIM domain protein Zasp isoform X2 [Octopus sinensis]CAI9726159.1 and LIM domain Zasp isoform X2 [Octopus vulgaris]